MMDFIIYDVKAAVILAVFYMFYRLLLSKETFHRLNRVVLLCTAVGSLLLPLFRITIHRTVEVEPTPLNFHVPEGVLPMIEQTVVTTPWWQILLSTLFILGVVAVLMQILISVYKVLRIISDGECRQLEGGIRLVITEKDVSPFSWMHTIVLSRKDYDDDPAAIISHEQAHIRLCHSWDLLLVDLVSSLQWFNPAIWMLRTDLRAVHEYEADTQVLGEGYNVKQYQYLLVKKAVGMSGYSVANSFNHRELKSRITMMCRKKSNRGRVLRALYLLPLVGACLALNARTQVDYVEKVTSSSVKVTDLLADDQIMAKESVVEEIATYSDSVLQSRDMALNDDTIPVVRIDEIRDSIIYVLDGERVKFAQINALNPSEIKTVRVLKDQEAVSKYGEEGKRGVMEIETKSTKDPVVLGTPATEEEMKNGPAIRIRSINGEVSLDSILVLIDGVQKTVKDIDEIDPLTILSFSVLRDKDAIPLYGDEAKNGVIIITTKKSEDNTESSIKPYVMSDSMRDYLEEIQTRPELNKEDLLSAMEQMKKTQAQLKEIKINVPSYYDAEGNVVDNIKQVQKCVFTDLLTGKKTEVVVKKYMINDEPVTEKDIHNFNELASTFNVKEDGTLCVYTLQYLVDKGMLNGFS
ncbi:MAG: hypothetical protein J6T82_02255 [Bacteroidaceae bacterium]|nr:hypothetical protein [Bacteroidaceae bacterium]